MSSLCAVVVIRCFVRAVVVRAALLYDASINASDGKHYIPNMVFIHAKYAPFTLENKALFRVSYGVKQPAGNITSDLRWLFAPLAWRKQPSDRLCLPA